MSEVKVNKVSPRSGTTVTIGDSGDTINLVGTLQNNGSPLAGDISSVVAGTGLSGGATSGVATLNIEAAQPTITSLGTITGFTSTGIDDNANALAITISSAENVGIGGTPSSTQRLIVNGDGSSIIGGVEFRNASSGGSTASIGMASGTSNALSIAVNDAANMVFKNTGGTERMRISSAGKVSIGNTNASSFGSLATDLVIGTTSGEHGLTIVTGTGNSARMQFSDNTSSPFRGAIEYAHSSDALMFYANGSQKMKITSAGLVGIGTTAPSYKLTIQASADNQDLIRLNHPSAATAGAMLGFTTDGTTANNVVTLGVQYSNADFDIINLKRSTQFVGISTTNPQEQLDISSNSPRIRFSDTSVTDLHHKIGSEANDFEISCDAGNDQASSHIGFKVDGSEKMRINDAGSVGIGTSAPTAPLHIVTDDDGNVDESLTIANHSVDAGTGSRIRFVNSTDISSTANSVSISSVRNGGSNHDLLFESSNSEKMRITSAGRVGIGEASPDTTLHVNGGTTVTKFERDSGTNGSLTISFPSTRATFDASGDLSIKNGGTERVRFHSGGVISATQGIALGVGTANTASNVLDDYEEGTWTPGLTVANAGTSGTYTKIGNYVFARFKVNVNATGSNIRITGLPFQSTGQTTGEQQGGSRETQSSGKFYFIRVSNNSTEASIIRYDANVSFNSSHTFEGQAIYLTT